MNQQPHTLRRQTLLRQIGDGVAIIPTAPERVRNRDSHYPYRCDSYFWYLSGFPEPEAVMVLIGGREHRSILFCREKNEEREVWEGFRHGPDAAREAYGFDETYAIGAFESMLPDLLANHRALWYAVGYDTAWDTTVIAALNKVRAQARSGKQAPTKIRDLRLPLDRMRLLKDEDERTLMRRAAQITSAGHARAMRTCHPGQFEYELEAELSHEFRKRGAAGHAYTPIVAGGSNACTLHYVNNDRPLAEHALVLIDAGCELDAYAASW